MEEKTSLLETLLERTEGYVKSSAELYKLKIIDKSADVISTLVARFAILTFFILFFLISNIGAALWIGELFDRAYLGFFIVAVFYGLVGIILFLFRNRWIKKPLKNSIITQALN